MELDCTLYYFVISTKSLPHLNYLVKFLIMNTVINEWKNVWYYVMYKDKVSLRLVHNCFNLGNSIHDEKFHKIVQMWQSFSSSHYCLFSSCNRSNSKEYSQVPYVA